MCGCWSLYGRDPSAGNQFSISPFFKSSPSPLSLYFLVLFSFIRSSFPLVIRSLSNLFLILPSSVVLFFKLLTSPSPHAGPHFPLLSTFTLLYSSYLFLILLSGPFSSPLIRFSSLPTGSSLLLNHHLAISSSLSDNSLLLPLCLTLFCFILSICLFSVSVFLSIFLTFQLLLILVSYATSSSYNLQHFHKSLIISSFYPLFNHSLRLFSIFFLPPLDCTFLPAASKMFSHH